MRALALFLLLLWSASAPALTVGSKRFAESHVLAEIAAQLLEREGFAVERSHGLGGSLIAWQALGAGDIDLYPAYTGTLARAVLKAPSLTGEALRARLAAQGFELLPGLGFDNSYAIAVAGRLTGGESEAGGLSRISELAGRPALRLGFSHEFLRRGDGWEALARHYGLSQQPRGVEHALAYRAVAAGELDGTDAYTTDGELSVHDLVLLEDDRGFFPRYEAALLVRADLPAAARRALLRLSGRIDATTMRRLNYRVSAGGEAPAAVAAAFLDAEGLAAGRGAAAPPTLLARVFARTLEHLWLTGLALAAGCVVAIPGALLLAGRPFAARVFLYATGLVQTIPALALLALLIPLLGLGTGTAIGALFLYSLLPVARNTLSGLLSIDPVLLEVADGIGLTRRQRLLRVQLPLAAPAVLAGVKTAAVVSVGTATLAAFVGAGGLGEPIITGLTLNDQRLILAGAIPAALLALAVELSFELLERALVPAHLRGGRAGTAASG
jgi:osmoprotectant transport system permease protein